MRKIPTINLSALNPFKRDRKDIAQAYARVFNSDDGQTVLRHLHDITAFYPSDPLETEAMLRHREGKRALVLSMIRMIEVGQSGNV